jgi:hypothetical protein
MLLRGPKTCRSLGPMPAVWLVTGYGTTTGRLCSSLSIVMFARPWISVLLSPLRSNWVTRDFVTHRREASCLLTTKQAYVLVPQRKKCLNNKGDYVEFRRVLCANHMPHRHRRYDKILSIRLTFTLFFGTRFLIKVSFFQEPHLSYKNIKLT